MNAGFQTKRLVTCALLTAIAVLLSGPLSIPVFPLGIYSLKIGLGALPVILSGILFGPVYGGIAGGLTDILQFVISPKGAYMPWFTVVGILTGLLPALFFRRGQKATLPRLFLAVGVSQVFCSVICNTALLVILYGVPLETILPLRVINQAVTIPVCVFLLYLLMPLLKKAGVNGIKRVEPGKE
ncbi:MAG TPA: folate family ECF transporter S component [Feifaniaceae bacterium]|nr:folate family ECF transporter S component [Feifaniaceae bacterium]